MDARKDIVRAGYDVLGSGYASWSRTIVDDPRGRFVDRFVALLDEDARVLDLGCGPGIPSTRRIAERLEVVGVDLSEVQLALARENVPGATFLCADLVDLDVPPRSFGGIMALYSITHVPREEHAAVFRSVARWLEPGGIFLCTLSVGGSDDWFGDFIGVPMFFSAFDADTSLSLLREAGLEIVADEVVEQDEPGEGITRFLWVIARRQR